MILEGTTSSGAVVPVQVTGDGKVVAEGLQGPEGPQGPQGPEGPQGPAGGYWSQSGQDLYPTDDTARVNLDSELRFANPLYYYASVNGESDGSGGRLSFATTSSSSTTPVERMQVRNSGIIGTFADNTTDAFIISSQAAAGTTFSGLSVRHSATGTITGITSFQVFTNGDAQNINNSYTGISDIKLKENIVDAKSQWDDIKGLRLVNYNFKAETGNQTHKQLGLIAQEVEKVCPGLVGETKDTETVEVPVLDEKGVAVIKEGKPLVTTEERETGEVTKNISYSVLYMKAVGALQEAMARIEKLEATLYANK